MPRSTCTCITTLLLCWICPMPPSWTSELKPVAKLLWKPKFLKYPPPVLMRGRMKKRTVPPTRVANASNTATPESDRLNRRACWAAMPTDWAVRSERRISMLMNVDMAVSRKKPKVNKNNVSTVKTAAASTIRNANTARYTRSRSRCTENILTTMMNSTRWTVALTNPCDSIR